MKDGISYSTHEEYLKNFGKTFYNSIKKLIDKSAKKELFEDKLNEKEKSLFKEIIFHANFSNKLVQKFHGRIELLKKVTIMQL